jgi:hypothetical protein
MWATSSRRAMHSGCTARCWFNSIDRLCDPSGVSPLLLRAVIFAIERVAHRHLIACSTGSFGFLTDVDERNLNWLDCMAGDCPLHTPCEKSEHVGLANRVESVRKRLRDRDQETQQLPFLKVGSAEGDSELLFSLRSSLYGSLPLFLTYSRIASADLFLLVLTDNPPNDALIRSQCITTAIVC